MSLSLSKILKVNVSTYENPFMDDVVNQMEHDLDDCKIEIKKEGGGEYECIKVDGIGLVGLDQIDCDDELDFDGFKKDLGQSIQDYLEGLYDLKKIFAKYGLEYTGISFYTPKAYNYESDSVDIHLKTMREEYDLEAMGLKELIEKYIDEVRQKSYDGYCSFEPTNFEDVGIDDYCTLWAILEKEGVRETMTDDLNGYFDEGFSELLWNNASPYYRLNRDWDKKYKLDYDNKILLLK